MVLTRYGARVRICYFSARQESASKTHLNCHPHVSKLFRESESGSGLRAEPPQATYNKRNVLQQLSVCCAHVSDFVHEMTADSAADVTSADVPAKVLNDGDAELPHILPGKALDSDDVSVAVEAIPVPPPPAPKSKPVSYFQLFRFCESLDIWLYIFGTIGSIGQGITVRQRCSHRFPHDDYTPPDKAQLQFTALGRLSFA